jgi:hypothetical protein
MIVVHVEHRQVGAPTDRIGERREPALPFNPKTSRKLTGLLARSGQPLGSLGVITL